MAASVSGRTDWSMTRDKEGHRTYKVKWLVISNDVDESYKQLCHNDILY